MTDSDDDLDFEGSEDTRENRDIKRLREKAKAADKWEKEATALREENNSLKFSSALDKAGVDLATPMGRLFKDAYKGEPDPEKIREAALEYGIIQPSAEQIEQQEKEQGLQRLATPIGAGQGAPAGTLNSDTYASWSPDVRRDFIRKHPREADALKRGETIPAVAGYM